MIIFRRIRPVTKFLLIVFGISISCSVSAQEYWKSNYPYSADYYQAWDAVSDKYLVSMSELAVSCDKLTGITDFADQPARFSAWSAFNLTMRIDGNELVIIPANANSINMEYANISCNFATWDGPSPHVSSAKMSDYKRSGILVDMKPAADGLHNAIIGGEIFVPEIFNTDKLFGYPAYPLGISVGDAHGHWLNYGLTAVDTITEFGKWVPFSINISDLVSYDTVGDAYSLAFNGMNYELVNTNSFKHSPVPIDFSQISAVNFTPLFGKGSKAFTLFGQAYISAEIRLRNITVGAGNNVRSLQVESSGLTNKKYWPDNGCFDDWATVSDKYMVGYHPDSAVACTGLKGLTYFVPQDTLLYKDWHRLDFYERAYSVEKKDSSMIVTPIPKFNSDNTLANEPNFFPVSFLFTRWAKGKEPILNVPYIDDLTLKGTELIGMVVDMRAHKQVSGSIRISGPLTDDLSSTLLTCNVIDAHGHLLNLDHTQYTQTINEFGSWINFTFLYDSIDNKCNGDIWSAGFHGISNPLYHNDVSQRKITPIDWEHITGIGFTFDFNRVITSALSTVEIKDIVVGDPQTAITYSAENIGPKGSLVVFDHLDTLTVPVEGKYSLTHLFKYKGQTNFPVHLSVESLTPGHTCAIVGDTAIRVVSADACNESGTAVVRFYNAIHKYADSLIVVIPNEDAVPLSFTDIPVQQSVSAGVFAPIDLDLYISNPCQRSLTVRVLGASQITLAVDDTLLAHIGLVDTTWMGSESVAIQIWYGAKLLHTFKVEFEQQFPASTAESVLSISSMAYSDYAVTPHQPVTYGASTFGADSLSWSLKGADSELSSEVSPTITYSEPGEYDVILTAFSSKDTVSDTITMTVIGIVAEQKNVCSGVAFSLSASLAGAEYRWSNNLTDRTITEVLTADKTYRLTVTEGDRSFVDSLSIHVYQPHTEELALATVSEDNKSVVLSWERSRGYGIANYKVLREGTKTRIYDTVATLPFDSLSVYVDIAANVTTRTYKYALVTENVCGTRSPLSRVHETVNLRIVKDIYGKAGLQWNQYQPDDIYESVAVYRVEKDTLILLEQISGTNTTYTDDKYKLGNEYRVAVILKDSIFPSRLKSDSGPFSQSMSNISEALVLGQSETALGTDVYVYPNPSNGACNIVIVNAQPVEYSVSVSDFVGTAVYDAQFPPSLKNMIQLPKLPSGVYTLNVSTLQGIATSKIVVE